MRVKNTIWLHVAIAVLLAVEAWLIYANKNLKSEISTKNNYLGKLSVKADVAETQFFKNAENVGITIKGKTEVRDTANNASRLEEIVPAGNFLICRISEHYCIDCVRHAISVIMDNKDSIRIDRVIFLSQDSNRNVFKKNIGELGLQGLRVLNCQDLGIPAEEEMFPYIMAVDSSLRVLSVYFPTKSTHGTDYDYRHVKYMYGKLVQKE